MENKKQANYLENSKQTVAINEIKEKAKKNSKNKGITLIALVVTIVVLLILAGVSITVLFGDSGIITMAQRAAKETQDAADKDRADLAELDKYLTSGNWGGTTTPTGPEEPKEPVFPEKGGKVPVQADGKTNVEWEETVGEGENEKTLTAKIPVGFCVVKDLKDAEGKITDENNITRGLVISDVANDDLNNSAKGNQFVWIPVDTSNNMENFKRIEGFERDARQSYLADCQEAGKEGITTTESIAMYQSVADNGGFYIARFEAGVAGTIEPITAKANAPKLEGEIPKPVSKKGVSPWNYIPWSTSAANGGDGTDKLPGDETQNGAVVVARSMYTKGSSCGVTSTLCYGVQWDAVMQFIDSNYLWKKGETDNIEENSFVRNSSNKGNYDETGNYKGELAVTGSNLNYQQNHIYDLAGNVYEWTMEAYVTYTRVCRGGDYVFSGSFFPASYRINNISVTADHATIGFRSALYL